MMKNYELQQYFLNYIRNLALFNPNKSIDQDLVYSLLIDFNIENFRGPRQVVNQNFAYWMDRYKNKPGINVSDKYFDGYFLVFRGGYLSGNEIKLYIPLDANHIVQGANQIFDFILNNGIEHQSKIAKIIRNDNIVVRVNSLEDANKIMNYVHSNPYIMEGLINVNPFLTNNGGIGLAMDNNYSYNSTLAQMISSYFNYLKNNNQLNLFTVQGLNNYINKTMEQTYDLDLKDIYRLLLKTTNPNFEYQDFINHAQNKLIDKYDDRKRVTDPVFYFENAIKVTERFYPENLKAAIFNYLNGNATYFTRKENARAGLIKYVPPGDVIGIMRSKLRQNSLPIPQTDNELINQYLSILLKTNEKNVQDSLDFEIIKDAYINTFKRYNLNQARTAFQNLFISGDVMCFTNSFGDRDKLKGLMQRENIRKVIFKNIDIDNMDMNDIKEIITRFEDVIWQNRNTKRKV